MLKGCLKLVIIGVVFFSSLETKAQFRVMATPSIEIPMVFDQSPKYNSTFGFKIGGFYEARRLSLGLSIGYHSFSSSEDISSSIGLSEFQLDSDPSSSSTFLGSPVGDRSCDSCIYTEEFGDLIMVPIMIEWNLYLLKMDKFKISAGLNVGLRIYSYSHVITFDQQSERNTYNYPYKLETINGTISTDKTDLRLNFSPKIAFEYLLTDKFSLYIEPAINLQSTPIGDFTGISDSGVDPFFGKIGYIPNSYTVDQMFTSSIGLGVIYNFGYPKKVQKKIEEAKKIMESEKIEWLPE